MTTPPPADAPTFEQALAAAARNLAHAEDARNLPDVAEASTRTASTWLALATLLSL